MTSEPDSDAVIVSRRPSNTSSSIPAVSPPADPNRGQRGSISFATAALSPANAIGSPPVSVRA